MLSFVCFWSSTFLTCSSVVGHVVSMNETQEGCGVFMPLTVILFPRHVFFIQELIFVSLDVKCSKLYYKLQYKIYQCSFVLW